MLKVIFLCQHKNLPSTRIRVFNLLPILEQENIKVNTLIYPKKISEKIRLFKSLKHYDVVVLQKKLLTSFETSLLRRFSKKLIFDFDDAIFINDDSSDTLESTTRLKRFKKIASLSDGIIAGNPYLAQKAEEYNKNVFILPSAVFTEGIPTKSYLQEPNDKLVLGWVGGGTNLHHLNMLSSALKTLSREIPFVLRVISNKKFNLEQIHVENIDWDIKTQDIEIAKFDVGLMPVLKNPWTQGKCSYKALQYMAAEVVPVATRFGFNIEVIEDRITGYLFDSDEEFINCILEINKNRTKALEMGKRSRKVVEEKFSVSVIGKRLANILKSFG
jgi:glycosyltransferase involved in cell wall biosynthesis